MRLEGELGHQAPLVDVQRGGLHAPSPRRAIESPVTDTETTDLHLFGRA
jgi:hypothetical protein